jgi:hypothetical protein
MKLTKEQIRFLDRDCGFGSRDNKWKLNSDGKVDVDGAVYIRSKNLTEIPVKFGRVKGEFSCSYNNLTTLKNCPDFISGSFYCSNNNLIGYFKNIKEDDFPLWDRFFWRDAIREYPFLINIAKKYFHRDALKEYLILFPLTKIYYRD